MSDEIACAQNSSKQQVKYPVTTEASQNAVRLKSIQSPLCSHHGCAHLIIASHRQSYFCKSQSVQLQLLFATDGPIETLFPTASSPSGRRVWSTIGTGHYSLGVKKDPLTHTALTDLSSTHHTQSSHKSILFVGVCVTSHPYAYSYNMHSSPCLECQAFSELPRPQIWFRYQKPSVVYKVRYNNEILIKAHIHTGVLWYVLPI